MSEDYNSMPRIIIGILIGYIIAVLLISISGIITNHITNNPFIVFSVECIVGIACYFIIGIIGCFIL